MSRGEREGSRGTGEREVSRGEGEGSKEKEKIKEEHRESKRNFTKRKRDVQEVVGLA